MVKLSFGMLYIERWDCTVGKSTGPLEPDELGKNPALPPASFMTLKQVS